MGDRKYRSQLELVAGLRREETDAVREFVRRYMPVAQRMVRLGGVVAGDIESTALTVLDDVLIGLARQVEPRISDLEGYVVIAARNHINAERKREEGRRQGNEEQRLGDLPEEELEALAIPERIPCSTAVERVYADVIANLSAEERELLAYVMEHVPPRMIGDWMNIEHGTARQRIFRLKRDLRRLITQSAERLPDGDRRQIRAIIARAVPPMRSEGSRKVAELPPGYDRPQREAR